MDKGRILIWGLVPALLSVLIGFPAAVGQTTFDLAMLQEGYGQAVHEDEPTRRFVELYLRIAGGVWILVEWTAAIFLVLGFRRLRRWFAIEEARDDA